MLRILNHIIKITVRYSSVILTLSKDLSAKIKSKPIKNITHCNQETIGSVIQSQAINEQWTGTFQLFGKTDFVS
jgi:hypothetical protein